MRAGRWVGGGRERTGRARAREGYQGGGEGRGGKWKRKGRGGGAQGTDVRVCVCLQDDGRHGMRSALHIASGRGLAGTVAQLLSLGAHAGNLDRVRACACMRTWSYTYSMRVYSLGAYIRLCYKNRHIHT